MINDTMLDFKQFVDAIDEGMSIVTKASGNVSATVRPRGSADRSITQLISIINQLKNTLFIQQVEDNGNAMTITFGKTNRPAITLYIQRRAANGLNGLKSMGINARYLVDRDGNRIDSGIALVSVQDRNGIYGYTPPNSRLRSLIRQYARVNNNEVVGVVVDQQTIDSITKWLHSIINATSGMAVITQWGRNVINVDKQSTTSDNH